MARTLFGVVCRRGQPCVQRAPQKRGNGRVRSGREQRMREANDAVGSRRDRARGRRRVEQRSAVVDDGFDEGWSGALDGGDHSEHRQNFGGNAATRSRASSSSEDGTASGAPPEAASRANSSASGVAAGMPRGRVRSGSGNADAEPRANQMMERADAQRADRHLAQCRSRASRKASGSPGAGLPRCVAKNPDS